MRRVFLMLMFGAGIVIACRGAMTPQSQPATATPPATPTVSPVQRFNDSVSQALLTRIGARQGDSASKVFINIQLQNLKGTQARTFISIMNGGYARALGVTCEHCHDLTDFSSDAKRPKLAAREMAVMHRMINQELAKMQYVATPASQNRAINCATCHRGAVNPR